MPSDLRPPIPWASSTGGTSRAPSTSTPCPFGARLRLLGLKDSHRSHQGLECGTTGWVFSKVLVLVEPGFVGVSRNISRPFEGHEQLLGYPGAGGRGCVAMMSHCFFLYFVGIPPIP